MCAQLCPTLCDPMDCSPQAPLSMGFSRQEHWSGLPFPHSVRAYNALAADKDRISEVQIEEMERTEQVPAGLKFSGRDPYFRKGQDVLLRRTSGNVQLTIFNAGHAGNYVQGAAWLSLQRRGRPTEWNVPPPGRSTGKANEVTK